MQIKEILIYFKRDSKVDRPKPNKMAKVTKRVSKSFKGKNRTFYE